MSRLSRAFKRLKAVGTLVAVLREQCPKIRPVLDAMEEDDSQGSWARLKELGDVAEALQKIPESARPYVDIVGPIIMDAIDNAIDEEALEAFLVGVGLLSAEAPAEEAAA